MWFAGIQRFVMSSHLGRFDTATCPKFSLLVIFDLRFSWPSCELKRQGLLGISHNYVVVLSFGSDACIAGWRLEIRTLLHQEARHAQWRVRCLCFWQCWGGLSECEIGESVLGNILDFLCVDQDEAFSQCWIFWVATRQNSTEDRQRIKANIVPSCSWVLLTA